MKSETSWCSDTNTLMNRKDDFPVDEFVRKKNPVKWLVLVMVFSVCLCISLESYRHVNKIPPPKDAQADYYDVFDYRLKDIVQSIKEKSISSNSDQEKQNKLSPFGRQRLSERTGINKAGGPSPAVLLLTYMRSGSSLTGDIIQRHEDVFYVFEPIYAIKKAESEHKVIQFLNGTKRYPGRYNKTELYMADLKGWLTCNFSQITVQSLFSPMMKFGRKTEMAYKCLHEAPHFRIKSICLNGLKKKCETSATKVVKTIRTSMNIAKEILKDISGSKVIHLVRDPRPTIQSRIKLDRFCKENVTNEMRCLKFHCNLVEQNVKELTSFEPDLKRRVLTVKYEDIIKYPLQQAKLLYKFIGLNYTDDITHYVYNITLGGNIQDCKICNMNWQAEKYSRNNFSFHISAWKLKLTMQNVIDIQNECKNILGYYGYKIYDLED